jgi:hypothetical protein
MHKIRGADFEAALFIGVSITRQFKSWSFASDSIRRRTLQPIIRWSRFRIVNRQGVDPVPGSYAGCSQRPTR